MDPKELARVLSSRPRVRLEPGDRKRAAVLVALAGNDERDWSTLLVVRAADLAKHPGQIGFPGGMIESTDADAADAALREAEEEVGLDRRRARVLGPLDDVVTLASSNVHITPVVAQVDGFDGLRADPREIARTFVVPLATFREPARRSWETYSIAGQSVQVPVFSVPERVWGATARIIHTLLDALGPA